MLQPRAVERAEQALGLAVVEMAEGAADALLQPLRIARRSTACRGRSCTPAPARPGRRASAGHARVAVPMSVSTPSRAAPSESTYCTGSRASCGTVNGQHLHPSTANDCSPLTNCSATPSMNLPSAFSARERAVREVDGDAMRGGEVEHAAGVVAVLVGDEDRRRSRKAAGRGARGAARCRAGRGRSRSARRGAARSASATRQLPRAAAGERGEAQQLTSAARAAARGCAARSSCSRRAPSLLRTLTWLASFPACVTCTRYCSAFTLGSLEKRRDEEAARILLRHLASGSA